MAQKQRQSRRQRGPLISLCQDHLSWKSTLALIVLAYVLVISIRFIWLGHVWNDPASWSDGQPITNNQDSVFFACIFQKGLLGAHQGNGQVPGVLEHGMITALPYAILKVFPISIEAMIVYLGPLMASLIVVPLVLIGRLYGSVIWGFLAAVLGGIAVSYFNRTFSGYFDTDMYSVTIPTVGFYFLLMATRRESLVALAAGSLALYLYPFFYRPGPPIVYALGGAFLIYRLALYRKEPFTWASLLMVSLALTLTKFSQGPKLSEDYLLWFLVWVLGGLGIVVAAVLLQKEVLRGRLLVALGLTSVVVFILVAAPYQKILNATQALMTAHDKTGAPADSSQSQSDKPRHLQFKNVYTAVRETKTIPWDVVARRISGSRPGAILAGVGYLVLCWKYHEFLIALPLVGVGLGASFLGLRFTIYAVPIAALGVAFLFVVLASLFTKKPKWITFTAVLATSLVAYPNITHAWRHRNMASVVLQKPGIAALETLSQEASDEDYVITWWDYGSSVWMYSGCQSLNSPASNTSPDNYLLSKILTTDSPRQAANLSREAVENFVAKEKSRSAIQRILRDRTTDLVDPNQFLEDAASKDFKPSEKTRDVYLFFPIEMLPIVQTIHSFSNRDLLTGEEGPGPQYAAVPRWGQRGNLLSLGVGHGINIDFKGKKAYNNRRQSIPLATFQDVEHRDGKPLKIDPPVWFDHNGTYHVVRIKTGDKVPPLILILDKRMLDSMVVQMFVFEKYDPRFFELTASTSRAKIYRVKK